jgi:hypothetical protein
MGFLGGFSWGFLEVVLVIFYISSLPEYSANGHTQAGIFFVLCTEDAHKCTTTAQRNTQKEEPSTKVNREREGISGERFRTSWYGLVITE